MSPPCALRPLLLALLLSSSCFAKKTLPSVVAPPSIDFETMEDVCDLIDMIDTMFCYCDFLGRGEGESANCLVYNGTSSEDRVWDTFYHQPNLHRLTISVRGQGRLDAVPTRALTYLHRLWTLDLKNATISIVHKDALARSPSLSDLVLSGNGIEELERRSFSQLTNVTRLNLGENRLQMINRHVFVEMPRLRQLYLDRNRISRIRSGAFVQLENLQELDLYDNALRTVSRGTFKGLSQLHRLDLHRNQLEVIGDRTFAELPELTELDLAENRIQYLGDHGLEGLSNLVRLTLRDNRLTQLQPATFRHTPNVFYLNLKQNRLQSLERAAFRPIMDNMRNITMYFYGTENRFQCDCRLAWLIRLRSQTASQLVKNTLESIMCVLERGRAPERLGGPSLQETPATGPEETQEGTLQPAQLPLKLVDLKISELPCDRPLAEEPVTESVPLPAQQQQQPIQKEPADLPALEPTRSSPDDRQPMPPPAASDDEEAKNLAEGSVRSADVGGGAAAVAAHGSLLLLLAATAAAR